MSAGNGFMVLVVLVLVLIYSVCVYGVVCVLVYVKLCKN